MAVAGTGVHGAQHGIGISAASSGYCDRCMRGQRLVSGGSGYYGPVDWRYPQFDCWFEATVRLC